MSESILSNPKGYESAFLERDLAEDLPIAGMTPFTTLDFPGHLAAVFYTQGCPWRCRYCYNWHLWSFEPQDQRIPWGDVRTFLRDRRGFLDGVVFSGGEPTVHAALPAAMKEVREMGFKVGLETNGMFPERLKDVIFFCDWVGMDIKAPFGHYGKVTLVEIEEAALRRSIDMILQSAAGYEFRTTFHPDLLSEKELLQMAKELSKIGVRHFALQAFRPEGCADEKLKQVVMPPGVISKTLQDSLRTLFDTFEVRE